MTEDVTSRVTKRRIVRPKSTNHLCSLFLFPVPLLPISPSFGGVDESVNFYVFVSID